ncbi:MAG: CDP-diacylglycerol--glycerol-3-phosphate 3-phosphatidyltransferase [Alphaproteobacteria bacterium]|nr:CDP-diacylglycerol--glycerol-3-phosphate 3-phosphatidyltransferase [Alphaproteobacteria bacterium]
MLKKKHIPNLLTYSRIAVIPLFIGVFYWDKTIAPYLAGGLFLYASITDFLDGYFARAWQATSSIGRFLDPIADKLLVATALVMLVNEGRADVLPAIAIVCREILVSGLREFLAEIRISVPVSKLAKFKTAAQLVAILLLLISPALPNWFYAQWMGDSLLWIAAILTLLTGYIYLKTGIVHLAANDAKRDDSE